MVSGMIGDFQFHHYSDNDNSSDDYDSNLQDNDSSQADVDFMWHNTDSFYYSLWWWFFNVKDIKLFLRAHLSILWDIILFWYYLWSWITNSSPFYGNFCFCLCRYEVGQTVCLVAHFLVVNTDFVLCKCNTQLRGLCDWVWSEEVNTPGPFTYKGYPSCTLLDDFWGDQVVFEMSMPWQIRLILLNGPSLTEVKIHQKKPPLFEMEIILIYNGWKHYRTLSKSW